MRKSARATLEPISLVDASGAVRGKGAAALSRTLALEIYRLATLCRSLENALVNPSCESNTKSRATSIILVFSSLSFTAARDSRSALMYSNGVLPVNSLKTLTECHGEYPAACASIYRVIGSAICRSI